MLLWIILAIIIFFVLNPFKPPQPPPQPEREVPSQPPPPQLIGTVLFDLEKDNKPDQFRLYTDGLDYIKSNKAQTPIRIYHNPDPLNLRPTNLIIHDLNGNGNPDLIIHHHQGPSIILAKVSPYQFINVTHDYPQSTLQKIQPFPSHPQYSSGNHLKVKLPKTLDFAGARVSVIIGKQIFHQFNSISTFNPTSELTFQLGSNTYIDKVKIRTIYNKDHNYLEPKINSTLHVKPMAHYYPESNKWRRTSSGA